MITLFLENDDEILVRISFSKTGDFLRTIPIRMYEDSAGYDLYSSENVVISKWSRAMVNTGLRFSIPKGFYGEVKPRSGLAIRNGIVAFNGTVDAGYIGFVYVIVFNFSDFDFTIKKNDRIAQIIFKKCHSGSFLVSDDLKHSDTDRGVKGFGSSGV